MIFLKTFRGWLLVVATVLLVFARSGVTGATSRVQASVSVPLLALVLITSMLSSGASLAVSPTELATLPPLATTPSAVLRMRTSHLLKLVNGTRHTSKIFSRTPNLLFKSSCSDHIPSSSDSPEADEGRLSFVSEHVNSIWIDLIRLNYSTFVDVWTKSFEFIVFVKSFSISDWSVNLIQWDLESLHLSHSLLCDTFI